MSGWRDGGCAFQERGDLLSKFARTAAGRMAHRSRSASHTIELLCSHHTKRHDGPELKHREKRRQHVGAAVQLFTFWSAIAEKPWIFSLSGATIRRSIQAA